MGQRCAIPIDEIVGVRGRSVVFLAAGREILVPESIANVEIRDSGRVVVVPRWFYERIAACRANRRRRH